MPVHGSRGRPRQPARRSVPTTQSDSTEESKVVQRRVSNGLMSRRGHSKSRLTQLHPSTARRPSTTHSKSRAPVKTRKTEESRSRHPTKRSASSKSRSAISWDDSADRGEYAEQPKAPVVIELPPVSVGSEKSNTAVVTVDLIVNGHPVQATIPVKIKGDKSKKSPSVQLVGLKIDRQ